jgi:hypothetical protein
MDPQGVASAIADYGFPIVSSGLLLYLVYFIWKFITEQIEPLIEEIHGTSIRLIDKVRMLDNDNIRLQQKLDTVIEIREAEHVKRSMDSSHATEIVHRFKNPSFSGVGTSSHYLTIENQEKSRKDKIKEEIDAELQRIERESENTTLAKFLRNLESRIYSQLSKQLVEQMFGNEEGAQAGSFFVEGNTVSYEKTLGADGQEVIIMTIVAEDGSITTIEIPIGVGNLGG